MLIAGIHEAPVSDWIRQHIVLGTHPAPVDAGWRSVWTAAEVESAAGIKYTAPSLDALCSIECRADLAGAQLARLRMGHLRYGACGVSTHDFIGACLAQIAEYWRGGNREQLADIANFIALEWRWPNRPCAWLDAWSSGVCPWPRKRQLCMQHALENYSHTGDRSALVHALDAVREEWSRPTHPQAHWAPLDCGGAWSLRNREAI